MLVSNVFEFPPKQYALSHLLEVLVFVSLLMCVTLHCLVLFASQSVSLYVPVSLSASVLCITLSVVTTRRCVCVPVLLSFVPANEIEHVKVILH